MLDLGYGFQNMRIREILKLGIFERRMDSVRGKCLAKKDCVFTLMGKYMMFAKKIPAF